MTKPPDLDAAAAALRAFLEAVGAPLDRDPELARTGALVAKAYAEELLAGYAEDPATILAETMPSTSTDLLAVTGLETATLCPHHLMPAIGSVHVGYVPSGRMVGLGAVVRLVRCFARRLSLQEALAANVAEALVTHLGVEGAGCVVNLNSTCLTVRGERAHGTRTESQAWRGSFATDASRRAELLSAIARHDASAAARP